MPVYIPTSLDAAVSLLDENPQSHLLTGGTDMMVEVNFNHRHPESVIALRAIAELKKWSVDTESVFIGAGV
ncbi:MAG: FAD binding domain-containing protein, partial [Ilumatobacteraceae bacterium]